MFDKFKHKMLFKLVSSFVGKHTKDGGQWGTLIRCPECSGIGLLHDLDEVEKLKIQLSALQKAPKPDTTSDERSS